MNVVGKKRIADFSLRHADAKSFLNAWVLEVEDAQWSPPKVLSSAISTPAFIQITVSSSIFGAITIGWLQMLIMKRRLF